MGLRPLEGVARSATGRWLQTTLALVPCQPTRTADIGLPKRYSCCESPVRQSGTRAWKSGRSPIPAILPAVDIVSYFI
jgi:hypothetical protein